MRLVSLHLRLAIMDVLISQRSHKKCVSIWSCVLMCTAALLAGYTCSAKWRERLQYWSLDIRAVGPKYRTAGLSNTAPYFTLLTLTLIGISRKKYFWITICFSFFRSTHMNTFFSLLKYRFLLYPFYCPLTPPFPFSLEKASASQVISSNK
jgi:hypothetical protein